jgi:sensor histidine kinase regulating citrate/malate metabolism
MYEHHDAVLHAISEGLVVIEGNRAVLVNDEARRLLDLSAEAPIDVRTLPGFLHGDGPAAGPGAGPGAAQPTGILKDEVHVTSDRVLVVNRSPVANVGSRPASVVTIRDRTELQGALGELDSMRVFAESLRSQAHESANRLHTIVALVEMGRNAEAVQFATTQLDLSQQLVDRLTAAVEEPALVALLLGKSSQAAERGVTLTVTEDTELAADPRGGLLTPTELVTVVGNLVDNALDACDASDPWVEVTVRQSDSELCFSVADSGAGMDPAEFARARRRGYSTKPGGSDGRRGLGLALVSQVVERHGGELTAEATYGSVVTVRIPREWT